MAQTPNQKKPNHGKSPLPKQPNRSNIVTLVVFLAVGIFFAVMMTRTMTATNGVTQTDELVTSEFTQAVEQGRVNTAVYDTGSYTITGTYYPAATAGEATTDAFNTAFNALNSGMASTTGARPTIVQTQELAASKLGSEHNYTCTWVGSDSLGQLMAAHPTIQYSVRLASPWGSILASILPILIIAGLLLFFFSQMNKANNSQMSFGKAKAKKSVEEHPDVHFSDVAGVDEAVEEMQEIKDFLENPAKYQSLGAKIPRGCLLVGPPGTGKTLLARAVAGEAGVPFFSISGSDFVEMFVGVGASRVRDLFEQAKQKAPCILFIDEIDAIGRARGKNAGFSGNDERENTLNQLLTEMDGFQTNTGVIVLAATNRVDILDKALMRAGRFDRQIEVGLPDVKEREEIFDVHLRPLKLDPELDRTFLAKQTPGFSGADIANVCNEAALIAARHNKKYVSREDFLAAIDRIIGGLERKNKIISDEEKRVIAYHEAGHATVSWILENASPLIKVTIIPRGKSLGAAWYLPEERQITTREQMMDELAAMLGGRVSEQINFGEVSTGALNDLERATKMAYAMVAYYGMSEKVGTISYYDSTGQSDMALTKPYSELTAQQIDAEAKNTIAEAYAMAAEVLRSHADGLKELAELLLEREVVFTEDVERIFGKRKKDILRERKEAEQKALAERKAASGDAEETAGKKEVASAEPRKDEEKISGTAASAVSDGKSSAETPEV